MGIITALIAVALQTAFFLAAIPPLATLQFTPPTPTMQAS
jgi:hypothetical protein